MGRFSLLKDENHCAKDTGNGTKNYERGHKAYKNDIAGLNETAGGYNVPKVT